MFSEPFRTIRTRTRRTAALRAVTAPRRERGRVLTLVSLRGRVEFSNQKSFHFCRRCPSCSRRERAASERNYRSRRLRPGERCGANRGDDFCALNIYVMVERRKRS